MIVGAISLTMSAIIVLCHLWKVIRLPTGAAVFDENDPLLLVFFYAIVFIFLAVALL